MSATLDRSLSDAAEKAAQMVRGAKMALPAVAGGVEGLLSSSVSSAAGGAGFLARRTTLQQHAEQLLHYSGWVSTSIRPVAYRIASQPFRVAKKAPKSKGATSNRDFARRPHKDTLPIWLKNHSEELHVLETHDFLTVINLPNAIMNRWQLMSATVAALKLCGKAYWWIYNSQEMADKRDVDMVIYPIPPSWVEAKHGNGRVNDYYEIKIDGSTQPVKVPREEIVCFYIPDPGNPLGSFSELQAQSRAVVSDEAISEAQRRAFTNGLFPGLALIAGRHPDISGMPGQRPILTRDQRDQLLVAIRQRLRGVQHMDEPIILDGVIEDVKKITNSPREMDFTKSGEVTKARIMQGFGTNPITVGQVEGANKASSSVADSHVVTGTVNPIIELISETLTYSVLPLFDDSGDVVAYIEPAKPNDPDYQLQEEGALQKAAAISVNEQRQRHGLPPIHGGDVCWVQGPGGLQPVPIVRLDQERPPGVMGGEEDGGSGAGYMTGQGQGQQDNGQGNNNSSGQGQKPTGQSGSNGAASGGSGGSSSPPNGEGGAGGATSDAGKRFRFTVRRRLPQTP